MAPEHKISDSPELGSRHPVFCVSRGRAQNHLHHERHRGLERQAPARGQNTGHFPTDEAATKLIWLVLRDATAEWKMPPREWGEAKSQFAILFEERFIIA